MGRSRECQHCSRRFHSDEKVQKYCSRKCYYDARRQRGQLPDYVPRITDLSGQKFGRWTVVSFAGLSKERRARWNCVCQCGETRVVPSGNLRGGTSKSCGCLARDETRKRRTHGLSRDPLFNLWSRMIARCHNENSTDYSHYGGRGIKVCSRWRNSFALFVSDMGPRPSKKHTIERKDVNGNYQPSNCVWATRLQQARNMRSNHILTFNGKSLCLEEWSEETSIPASTIRQRINMLGWSVEKALTQPVRKIKAIA